MEYTDWDYEYRPEYVEFHKIGWRLTVAPYGLGYDFININNNKTISFNVSPTEGYAWVKLKQQLMLEKIEEIENKL